MHGPCFIRIKKCLYGICDTIDLCKCSDTKQTYTNTEKCKNLCQPSPFCSHTFFNVVERATHNMTILCNGTIFHCQQTFRILCSHTYKGSYPHPEQCTRTSGYQRGCNTDDVTCTDGCGQCSTQCCKTGYFSAVTTFFIYKKFLDCTWQKSNLQTFDSYGQKYTDCQNEDDQGNAPYKIVD